MADIYVRSSDGDDGDDGSTWALAKATYQAAATAAGADGVVYMDDGHRETFSATKTFNIPDGIKTLVVVTDTTTLVTSPNTTANLECTTTNDQLRMEGVGYFWGISLKTTQNVEVGGAGSSCLFENCLLVQTASAGALRPSADGCLFEMVDCEVSTYMFKARYGGTLIIKGCTYSATPTAPTTLFQFENEGGNIIASGNDLSAYTGTNIIDPSSMSTSGQSGNLEIVNNRIPSGVTLSGGRAALGTQRCITKLHGNGNGDEYYQILEDDYGGIVQESLAVDRVGGATYDGTNLFSVSLTGNANTSYHRSVLHKLRVVPVDATSGATIKVHLAYDKGTTLNNSDIALHCKYHDATNQAHGKWEREKALGPLDTGDRDAFTDVSVAETWNGTGAWGTVNEETIEATFTGANGLVEVWVELMSNETVYFCPAVEVS